MTSRSGSGRSHVGRITLYLLDADVEGNQPADRAITSRLYGGDRDMRIRQELLLGIGGVRALDALGRRPEVCHMNEGHSSFLALERIRQLMARGRPDLRGGPGRRLGRDGLHHPHPGRRPATTRSIPARSTITSGDYYRELGLSRSEFMALGRLNPSDEGEPFSMTILALRLAGRSNGVSILHGGLSRRLWGGVWPGLAEEEVPTGSVTNGVHLRTWLAPELSDLYEGMQSPDEWSGSLETTERLRAIDEAPARDLWDRHERLRGRAGPLGPRARLASQLARQNAGPAEVSRAVEALDPKIADHRVRPPLRRVQAGDAAPARPGPPDPPGQRRRSGPVQFIFAGKAHPSDNGGKELLRVPGRAVEARRGRAAGSSSWRTTTSAWRAGWSRASTSG